MASKNEYENYKRDTKYLVYWMIRLSNKIIANDPELQASWTPNTTGQTNVTDMVNICKLIAENVNTEKIPPVIYKLFLSVISARKRAHSMFERMASLKQSPDIVQSNNSHRFFLEALQHSFEVLGGIAWRQRQTDGEDASHQTRCEVQDAIFCNKFEALDVSGLDEDHKSESEEDVDTAVFTKRSRQSQPAKGRGRKNRRKTKRMKAKNGNKHGPHDAKNPLDDISWKDYALIEESEGVAVDYFMAVSGLFTEINILRAYMQSTWNDFAHEQLNIAVAGGLSNVAVGLVQQMATEISVDFPEYDSFNRMIDVAKCIAIERIQPQLDAERPEESLAAETVVDPFEAICLNTFQDLCHFVHDYSRNRSGKPTPAMLAQISPFNPLLDLQDISHSARMQWRRAYTINWLYDLVNLFRSSAELEKIDSGKAKDLSQIDWTSSGPYASSHRVFGLRNFAAFITTLATQKDGTEFESKILPQHVFQLQLIVDSFTISCGWQFEAPKQHIICPRPKKIRPLQDVALFLDRECNINGNGFMPSIKVADRHFTDERNEISPCGQSCASRHVAETRVMLTVAREINDWLGKTSCKGDPGLGLKSSRFSQILGHNNGLWELSPFLCGVGLLEALELAYRSSMMILDQTLDLTKIAQLHDILSIRKKIMEPCKFLKELIDHFHESFCPPSLVERRTTINQLDEGRPKAGRRVMQRIPDAPDLHDLLAMDNNIYYNQSSVSILYRAVDWNPEQIRSSDIPTKSFLAIQRLFTLYVKGETDLEVANSDDADLIVRTNKMRGDDWLERCTHKGGCKEHGVRNLPVSAAVRKTASRTKVANSLTRTLGMPLLQILDSARLDFENEIEGNTPVMSLNYLKLLVRATKLFETIETRLEEVNSPIYEKNCNKIWRRGNIVHKVYRNRDREDVGVKIVAEEIKKANLTREDFAFWKVSNGSRSDDCYETIDRIMREQPCMMM